VSKKLAIAIGFVAVFAMSIALIVLMKSGAAASDVRPTTPVAARETKVEPAPAPVPAPAPADAQRDARPAAAHRSQPQSSSRPELGTTAPSMHNDAPRDENGKLVPVINVRFLREEMARTTQPMQDCLAKAGVKATGTATLGFTVAQKNGKLVVESSGVLEDQTLAQYPDLLECMHQTATALQPVLDANKAPDLGTAIYVRRHVKLDNGAMVENSIFNFSYVP